MPQASGELGYGGKVKVTKVNYSLIELMNLVTDDVRKKLLLLSDEPLGIEFVYDEEGVVNGVICICDSSIKIS